MVFKSDPSRHPQYKVDLRYIPTFTQFKDSFYYKIQATILTS